MKVLVVSYYSGWSSSVGSRRMNGLVRALVDDGHTVTVVTSAPPNGHRAPPVPGAEYLVTGSADRVLRARALAGRVRGRPASRAASAPAPTGAIRAGDGGGIGGRVRATARAWVSFPDTMWEWSRTARRAVAGAGVTPDLVIASAPPMAALHAAAAIAHRHGVPWIADMRDLWAGDPYRVVPRVARPLDRRLERRVLRSASAITTVADTLADDLRAVAPGVPVHAMRNGFEASWLRDGDDPPLPPPAVVYTGTLTANTGRDLTAICDAAAILASRHGGASPRLRFYGAVDPRLAVTLTERAAGVIELEGVVGADEARAAQHGATALLNLSWENPRDFGKCPAKLFEYAAARRPILHVGRVETLGVQLIRDHALGTVVDPNDPIAIADAIDAFAAGGWAAPPVERLQPLSQTAMIDGFRRVIRDVTLSAGAADRDDVDPG